MLRPTLMRAAALSAAVLALAACGGGEDGREREASASAVPPTQAPATADPAPATVPEAQPAPTASETDDAPVEHELLFDPDPAFLTGIEEAWRVPGLVPMNDPDHGRFAVWREGSMVAVYEATAEASEPVWETGPCASFGFFGDMAVCDSTVTDLTTGETAQLPIEGAIFMHSNADNLVMLTGETVAVGFDSGLNEIWRVENVAPIGLGTASVRTIPALPADLPPEEAVNHLHALDAATGEVMEGGLRLQEVADGYVTLDPVTGTVAGIRWDGSEAFRVAGETTWGGPMPLLGRMLTLADVQACVDLPDSSMPLTGANGWSCLSSGGTITLAEISAQGAAVEGVTYPGATLLNYFVDTEHVLAAGSTSQPATIALYEVGAAAPVWEIQAGYGLIPMADGSLLLGSDGPDTILYRPAG